MELLITNILILHIILFIYQQIDIKEDITLGFSIINFALNKSYC